MKYLLILLTVLSTLSCQLDSLADYTPKGNRYALVIGVQYEGYEFTIDDEHYNLKLSYTEADAIALGNALESYGYDVTKLLSSSESVIEKDAILDALKVISPKSEDQVIFFFAGHGEIIRGEHYLLMERETDSSFGSWDDWYENVKKNDLSATELLSELEQLGVPAILLIDACYTGGFIPDDPHSHDRLEIWWDEGNSFPKAESIRRSIDTFFSFPDKTYEPENIWVMSASGSGEWAMEGLVFGKDGEGGDHGAFTYFMLEGLKKTDGFAVGDANRDGVLLLSELYGSIIDGFKDNKSLFGSDLHYPRLSGSSRDIILGKYR